MLASGAFSAICSLSFKIVELRFEHLWLIKARGSYRWEIFQHHIIIILRVVSWLIWDTLIIYLRLWNNGLIKAHCKPNISIKNIVGDKVLLHFSIDPLLRGILGFVGGDIPSINKVEVEFICHWELFRHHGRLNNTFWLVCRPFFLDSVYIFFVHDIKYFIFNNNYLMVDDTFFKERMEINFTIWSLFPNNLSLFYQKVKKFN